MRIHIAAFPLVALLLLFFTLNYSNATERSDFSLSYHGGVPNQVWATWIYSGCYFWPRPDPYWEDPPFYVFDVLKTVRFYNTQLGVQGSLPFRIAISDLPRSLLPRASDLLESREDSERNHRFSTLYISDYYYTHCDECWIEVELNLDLGPIGYPTTEESLLGVFVLSENEGPEPGQWVPAIPVDSSIDHPFAGCYASDLPGEVFISTLPEEWEFGDILLEVVVSGGITHAEDSSFSAIKSLY